MIQWGLISNMDSQILMKTLDLIINDCNDMTINVCEVGVYSGRSGSALARYINSKDRSAYTTGIDNQKDGEEIKYHYDNLIIGNSNEVYNQIEDNSQHLIFVDGCHCFAHVISDFFCYAPKIKVGGYFSFHDTGEHIKPFKDFQHGDKENPDAYISVRKALKSIGILDYTYSNLEADGTFLEEWQLIFDEADENNEAGGITVFLKK